MAQVGPHGQGDGLESEAAAPVDPVDAKWARGLRDLQATITRIVREYEAAPPWPVVAVEPVPDDPCPCPPCRALAAPATGDE